MPRIVATLLPALLALLAGCTRERAPLAAPAAPPGGYGRVDAARLAALEAEPGQWLTAGRDAGLTHYSPLADITRDNVARVGFAWSYDTRSNRGLQATPIVVDGVMYTSGPAGRVFALDARDGRELWTFDPKVDGQVARVVCCDNVNRGVAVWQGRVYVASLDARLHALDAATGRVLWQVDTVIDPTRGYASTGAPQVAGEVVVIGNSGGEFDARGYVSAYDLASGELRWRFFTVPGDPAKPFEHPELEAAAKTWPADAPWELGLGAPAWDGMAYDAELDLLYVATGNAAPWSAARRGTGDGDNLFVASVLAIEAKSGRLAWHYQEVPGDAWDYDANSPFVLTELTLGGQRRRVLLHAPKNGLFYVLDRATGQVLSAKDFVPVNWVKSFEPGTGRPIVDLEAVDYRRGPRLVFPYGGGAHSWQPMAFSAATSLVYLPVVEGANVLLDAGTPAPRRPRARTVGTTPLIVEGGRIVPPPWLDAEWQRRLADPALLAGLPAGHDSVRAYLDAWDPVAQRRIWRVPQVSSADRGGVLATAGGLVVQGNSAGELRFHDDRSGQTLHVVPTGTSIAAAPMSYSVDGVQYVAVMAGGAGGPFPFAPRPGSAADERGPAGRILAFRLGGGAVPLPPKLPPAPAFPEPPPRTASAAVVAEGGALFADYCSRCHVNRHPWAATPDLRRMTAGKHAIFEHIVLRGALRAGFMPQFDDLLSVEQVRAIHAWLIDQQHQAREGSPR